jgi:RNA-binding protein YhbY
VHIGDWLSLIGLMVSVVGFAFAIWQLTRTANASVATRQAIERTEKRMALNHLLIILPQFRLLENDLDSAADTDDRPLARRSLVAYSHFAAEVATILDGQNGVDQKLVHDIRESATLASRVKAALVDAPKERNTKQLTKNVRETISALSVHIGSLATTYQISSE